MAARSPTRYGRYEIVGPLATGGMADLHLARASGPSGFESLAVVKRIRPHLAANPDFVRLFLGEARLAAGLRHPNVVAAYDAGQEHGEYYFVMEFVHGRDLRAVIDHAAARKRPISFDEAVTIAIGVCAGLHHAHEATDPDGAPLGIVHRDVSPSNVLVSFDGAVKLADFGIAKPTQAREGGTNTLRGKLTYMSPEQSLGAPLDRRSDLYSLAVVLYELTTGTRPFGRAASEFLEVKQTLETPPRPPSTHRRDYPLELEHIVLRALSRDRERRYATAREMQLELEAFARRRQLAISPLTLEHMMGELFAAELDAWQLAQRRGTSLAQHVTDTHSLAAAEAAAAARAAETTTPSPRADETTTPSPAAGAETVIMPTTDAAAAPARSRRVLVTTAALAAAGIVAFVVTAWPTHAPEAAATAATAATATATAAAANARVAPATTAPASAPVSPATTTPATAPVPLARASRPAPPEPVPSLAAATHEPARVRVHTHAAKPHPAKRARGTTWDPEAAVLPH